MKYITLKQAKKLEQIFLENFLKKLSQTEEIYHPHLKKSIAFPKDYKVIKRNSSLQAQRLQKKYSAYNISFPQNEVCEIAIPYKKHSIFFIAASLTYLEEIFKENKITQSISRDILESFVKKLALTSTSYNFIGIYAPAGWQENIFPISFPNTLLNLMTYKDNRWRFVSATEKRYLDLFDPEPEDQKFSRCLAYFSDKLQMPGNYVIIEKACEELEISFFFKEKIVKQLLLNRPEFSHEEVSGKKIIKYPRC